MRLISLTARAPSGIGCAPGGVNVGAGGAAAGRVEAGLGRGRFGFAGSVPARDGAPITAGRAPAPSPPRSATVSIGGTVRMAGRGGVPGLSSSGGGRSGTTAESRGAAASVVFGGTGCAAGGGLPAVTRRVAGLMDGSSRFGGSVSNGGTPVKSPSGSVAASLSAVSPDGSAGGDVPLLFLDFRNKALRFHRRRSHRPKTLTD